MDATRGEQIPRERLTRLLARATVVVIASMLAGQSAFPQLSGVFHQTLAVAPTEPVALDVQISKGDLEILYSRDGEVSITGTAQAFSGTKTDPNFFKSVLAIEQKGNHLTIRHVPNPAYPEEGINITYRIDVPYRTEVISRVNHGKQVISGIMGPVKAVTEKGDIKASYVSKELQAQADTGNLDLQVIGDHVEARTRRGNISCTRAAQGITAETEDGDISLMVIGPSTATVKKGTGRIDVGGARGSFLGVTDSGDLHVKAIPHDDWQLRSASGNIRLELPPVAKLELDATASAGELQIDRDDIAKPDSVVHHLHQKMNGGGKQIEVQTASGRIVIQ